MALLSQAKTPSWISRAPEPLLEASISTNKSTQTDIMRGGERGMIMIVKFGGDAYCQAQPKPQPANPQLGAEIALFSQLWGTTIRSPE